MPSALCVALAVLYQMIPGCGDAGYLRQVPGRLYFAPNARPFLFHRDGAANFRMNSPATGNVTLIYSGPGFPEARNWLQRAGESLHWDPGRDSAGC
jgi:hypothetical protein